MSALRGFLSMVGAEWRKARGRGLAWAVLLFAALHGVGAVAMLWLGQRMESSVKEGAVDSLTWLVSGELAVKIVALPVQGLALLLLFSMLFAEDFSLGTIAMIFVRPVPRWMVFIAKATVGVGVALASASVALAVGLGGGLLAFGLGGDLTQIGPDTPFFGWLGGFEGGAAHRAALVLGGVLTATLVALPLLGSAALFGALLRSPVGALFGSMMFLLADAGMAAVTTVWSGFTRSACAKAASVSGEMVRPEDLATMPCADAVLPERLHDLTIWAGRSFLGARGEPEFWAAAGFPLAVTLGWSALLLGGALLLFTRRDVD